jgi:PEP-CTERM motif-containing protein
MPARPGVPTTTRCLLGALMIVAVAGLARTTEAAPIVFTDRAAFELAAQPNLFEDFDGPLVQCVFVGPGCQITYSGLTFQYDTPNVPYSIQQNPPPSSLGQVRVGPDLTVLLSFAPIRAIGFDASGFGANPFELDVFIGGVLHTIDQPGFLGFLAPPGTTYTGLSLFSNNQQLSFIDNVAATTIPEPATLLLFAAGSSAVFASRRYRHTRNDSA